MFVAVKKKKKSRDGDGKDVKGDKKKKTVSKPSEMPKPSPSTSSQDDQSFHVLGVIESTSVAQTTGELQTPANKSKISSDGKRKEKKKNKKEKVSTGKENVGSDLPEAFDSTLTKENCGKKDSMKQESEKKKKKRKSEKLDMEGQSEPKKPKMKKSKRQSQEDGVAGHGVWGQNEASINLDHAEQQSANCSTADVSTKEDEVGKGLSKQGSHKSKKLQFWAASQKSSQSNSQASDYDPERMAASKNQDAAENSKPKKNKKSKSAAAPQNLSQQPNSQSSSSGMENHSSPNLAAKKHKVAKGLPKLKKPNKPKFGAGTVQCCEQLSGLAEELGEIMKETKKESSVVEELPIPAIKPKKTVPVFGKNAPKM